MAYNDTYRPQYHFTPPKMWLNDPNGLVYYDGEYHLFYQHNPNDIVWGPMHWGHAVSSDLINWQHLPIALYPDEIGAIFSGCALIDWQNTAGFGEAAMVAIFTHDTQGEQKQSIAYSNDKGRTWTKYKGNPVIDSPDNLKDFRDPKVFWYENEIGDGHWVMVVVAGREVLFYSSQNLIDWKSVGSFGNDHGATCAIWETPDLFELPIDGGPETRWVLTAGIGGCAPAEGSGMQYFIGDFDGEVFINENPKETVLWVDYGADFYAAQSWNQTPDGRRIWTAWMNNWMYANDIPASTWRGTISIPRQLELVSTPKGAHLIQKPIQELTQLRGGKHSWRDIKLNSDQDFRVELSSRSVEVIAEFNGLSKSDAQRLEIRICSGRKHYTLIGYLTKTQTTYVDRTSSGEIDFNPNFPARHSAQINLIDGRLNYQIFIDRTTLELFVNNGRTLFSEQIFPPEDHLTLEFFVERGEINLSSLDVYYLNPASYKLSSGEN